MGEVSNKVSKKVSKFVERFGSKILLLLFIFEFLITSSIWITEKITIEMGFGNIFLLNTYALLPYIINFSGKGKEPNKREYVIIIDFYSSVVFWGISRIMDFNEFNVPQFYIVLVILGFSMSIIYLLRNQKPILDSLRSIIQLGFSILIVLITIGFLIWVLIIPPTLLPLVPAELQLFWFIFYIVLIVALIILIFKPETKKKSS